MTYEEAVKDIAEELRTNRNGAYGLAVRLAATNGGSADKLMADAVEFNKQGGGAAGGAPELVDVPFPTADVMAAQVLEQAEALGGLGPDTMVVVPLLVQLMVEERNRFLQMLGMEQ